ncbi:MAG TPA: M3 family metallopeptidase, partial [Planctomycetaceae bacterium]|nr:M3 family metallopeptidase [Planctomycetaceae bacterium]
MTFILLAAGALCRSTSAQSPGDSPVAAALQQADYAVEQIVAVPDAKRSFNNTVRAIDDVVVRLRLDTDFLQFMAYVSPDAALRDKGQRAEEDVRNWLIGLTKREDLYRAVRTFADTKPDLEGEPKRLLEYTLRDFRRAGMELSAGDRETVKALETELAKLEIEFERNIREDETVVPLTREELAGMPVDWLAQQPQTAGLYLVGMEYPSFLPLMDYCENEASRQKVWTAYKRRGGQKNVRLLERVLKLRAEIARLLGYQHFADYETEILMAKSAREVLDFYEKLRPVVRTKAKLDWEEFTAAKREHTGDAAATLRPWDQSFYEKRLMKTRYAVDAEKVREYFPLERVIEGLFSITQSLYQVT